MSYRFLACAVLLLAAPIAASAQSPVDQLLKCRAEADTARRLACFDGAAGALDAGLKSGAVAVSTRRITEAQAKAEFGLTQRERADAEREAALEAGRPAEVKVTEITSKVAWARRHEVTRLWTVGLAEGGVWRQTEGARAADLIRPGAEARIRAGGLGGFSMLVDGARPMRVKRVG